MCHPRSRFSLPGLLGSLRVFKSPDFSENDQVSPLDWRCGSTTPSGAFLVLLDLPQAFSDLWEEMLLICPFRSSPVTVLFRLGVHALRLPFSRLSPFTVRPSSHAMSRTFPGLFLSAFSSVGRSAFPDAHGTATIDLFILPPSRFLGLS